MELNKSAMKLRRENPTKLQEILGVAHNTDLDKEIVLKIIEAENKANHLSYGGFISSGVIGATGIYTLVSTSLNNGNLMEDAFCNLMGGIVGFGIGGIFGIVAQTCIEGARCERMQRAYSAAQQDARRNFPE